MAFFVYLIESEGNKQKRTYVGFTNDPKKRIRQHNGEILGGAHKTRKGRPWHFISIVGPFPNKVSALQFEWQWQHPNRSRRDISALLSITNTSINGWAASTKLKIVHAMLSTRYWGQLALVVHIFDSKIYSVFNNIDAKNKKLRTNGGANNDNDNNNNDNNDNNNNNNSNNNSNNQY